MQWLHWWREPRICSCSSFCHRGRWLRSPFELDYLAWFVCTSPCTPSNLLFKSYLLSDTRDLWSLTWPKPPVISHNGNQALRAFSLIIWLPSNMKKLKNDFPLELCFRVELCGSRLQNLERRLMDSGQPRIYWLLPIPFTLSLSRPNCNQVNTSWDMKCAFWFLTPYQTFIIIRILIWCVVELHFIQHILILEHNVWAYWWGWLRRCWHASQSIHLAFRFKSPVLERQSPLLDLFLSLEHTRPQRKQ